MILNKIRKTKSRFSVKAEVLLGVTQGKGNELVLKLPPHDFVIGWVLPKIV